MAADKNTKHITWLYSQLDILAQKNVIGAGTAQNIREFYGDVGESKKITARAIFTSLGLSLIGFGLILIVAFNWSHFPRYLKIILSLMPLFSALLLAFFAYKKRNEKVWLSEGAGAFWFLSIGATIALISQTYHIQGDLSAFLLLWIVLSLPVFYALQSSFAYFFYLCGVIWWAILTQMDGGYAMGFWPLMAAAFPFFIQQFRKNRYSASVVRNSLLTAVAFTVGTGVSLEKCLPGLWIVIYPSLFSVMYLSSGFLYKDREGVLRRPFQWYSVLGITALSFIFTQKWPWDDIGWHYFRNRPDFNSFSGVADYALAFVVVASAVILLVRSIRYKKNFLLDFGLAPIIAILCFLIMAKFGPSFGEEAMLSVLIIMNVYIVYLGLKTILTGIKLREMIIINGGMLMLGVLIMMRFFDLDFSLLQRGFAFIGIGAVILALNSLIAKKIGN